MKLFYELVNVLTYTPTGFHFSWCVCYAFHFCGHRNMQFNFSAFYFFCSFILFVATIMAWGHISSISMDHGSLPLKVMVHIFPNFHSLTSHLPYFFLSPSLTRGYGEHHKLVQWSCAADDFGVFKILICVLKAEFSAKYITSSCCPLVYCRWVLWQTRAPLTLSH